MLAEEERKKGKGKITPSGVITRTGACRIQVLAVYIVPVQPPLRVLLHAHTSSGVSLIAHVRGIVSFLFLGDACNDFGSLGWAVVTCQIATGRGRLADVGHVCKANRVCLACNSGTIGDIKAYDF